MAVNESVLFLLPGFAIRGSPPGFFPENVSDLCDSRGATPGIASRLGRALDSTQRKGSARFAPEVLAIAVEAKPINRNPDV